MRIARAHTRSKGDGVVLRAMPASEDAKQEKNESACATPAGRCASYEDLTALRAPWHQRGKHVRLDRRAPSRPLTRNSSQCTRGESLRTKCREPDGEQGGQTTAIPLRDGHRLSL